MFLLALAHLWIELQCYSYFEIPDITILIMNSLPSSVCDFMQQRTVSIIVYYKVKGVIVCLFGQCYLYI